MCVMSGDIREGRDPTGGGTVQQTHLFLWIKQCKNVSSCATQGQEEAASGFDKKHAGSTCDSRKNACSSPVTTVSSRYGRWVATLRAVSATMWSLTHAWSSTVEGFGQFTVKPSTAEILQLKLSWGKLGYACGSAQHTRHPSTLDSLLLHVLSVHLLCAIYFT